MNLQFNTDKEKRAFELLQKYFKGDVEKHLLEVNNLVNLALKNGYSKEEIGFEHSIFSYKYGVKEPTISRGIKTVVFSDIIREEISINLNVFPSSFVRQTPSFQNTKQQNEAIVQQNKEIDELLSLMQ